MAQAEIAEALIKNNDWADLYSVKNDADWEFGEVFEDVTPLKQDDGPEPICRIAYKPSFELAMNYFRAVIRLKEYSKRSFQLTSICLKHNPANYTVWHYRRICLTELSISNTSTSPPSSTPSIISSDPELVELDLEFAAQLGGANPKNYQVWYHRRALLESVLLQNVKESSSAKDGSDNLLMVMVKKELSYIASVLKEDAKNYHAWSHRQWLLRTSNDQALWTEDLEFAHSLLLDDMRNNSAWNHRWFICHQGGSDAVNVDILHKEAQYALHAVEADPFNESPWRYLIGLLKEHVRNGSGGDDVDNGSQKEVLQTYDNKLQHMVESYNSTPGLEADKGQCHYMLGAHIDILEMMAAGTSSDAWTKAADLAHSLATEHDLIRRKYWLFREEKMRKQAT